MEFFTGLWPIVEHFGIGGIGVAAGVAFWFFSPIGKKIGLIVAVVAGVVTGAYGLGVSDGEHRVQAQWTATENDVNQQGAKARANAEQEVPALVDPSPKPGVCPPPAGGVQHPRRAKPLDGYDRG